MNRHYLKKFLVWAGALCAAVYAFLCLFLFNKKTTAKRVPDSTCLKMENKIEKVAESKRQEAYSSICSTSPSDIAEDHPAVRAAIEHGIDRFRKRCGTDN